MNNELRNYFRRCIKPNFAFNATISLVISLFWAVLRRIAPNFRYFTMPITVSRAKQELLAKRVPIVNLIPASHLSPGRLKLTIGYIDFINKPDWHTKFTDPEIGLSLHRWNWLLRGLTDSTDYITRDQGVSLIRSWLSHCLHIESFGKDAYSTAERITNGSIFLLKTGDGSIPFDIKTAFQFMGYQIAANLEYYEGDLTGNHAFNNARGLLFSCTEAAFPEALELASEIIGERLPKLVTEDGFLREGSSHYHFLFTRWILEMLWISKKYHYSVIINLLEPYAHLLVKRCWFFLIKDNYSDLWQFPLVGDVSPDFPPNWLLSLPWSKLALEIYSPLSLPMTPVDIGWASIFGIVNSKESIAKTETLSFSQSFWHRIEFGKFILIVHAQAESGKRIASHKHNDLIGFVLYIEGKPMLFDCGRLDYTNSALSNYGKESLSHNSLLINNLPPFSEEPSWTNRHYRSVDVNTNFNQSLDSATFSIEHNGFSRLAGVNVLHKRTFTLKPNSFTIEDQLFGTDTYNILLRFHYPTEFDFLPKDKFRVYEQSLKLEFVHDNKLESKKIITQEEGQIGGYYFPEYGVKKQCITKELTGTVKLPSTIRNQIILKD